MSRNWIILEMLFPSICVEVYNTSKEEGIGVIGFKEVSFDKEGIQVIIGVKDKSSMNLYSYPDNSVLKDRVGYYRTKRLKPLSKSVFNKQFTITYEDSKPEPGKFGHVINKARLIVNSNMFQYADKIKLKEAYLNLEDKSDVNVVKLYTNMLVEYLYDGVHELVDCKVEYRSTTWFYMLYSFINIANTVNMELGFECTSMYFGKERIPIKYSEPMYTVANTSIQTYDELSDIDRLITLHENILQNNRLGKRPYTDTFITSVNNILQDLYVSRSECLSRRSDP